MENQVEEIKRKVNIVDVISVHVALKKKGKNFVGLCPFHGEKTGSFMVNEELQIYKCFGCSAGGDVYKFLMEVEGLTFPEALEKMADKAGVKLAKRDFGEKDTRRELIEVHDLATEYYHYLLTKHPAGEIARKYLQERGISQKLIETFRLGFSLPEWDGLVKYLVGKKKYSPEVLVAAGLVSGGVGKLYDRFRGRVMFPLLDISSRVVGFSGRVLPGAKDTEAKYINSPETEIYHKSKMLFGLTIARGEIKKKDRVVLVEGELDMISSFAAGITETVAIKGSAITSEMMAILSRLTNTFVLALDADAAGEAAMKRSIEEAEKLGLSMKMVNIIGGKDPDEIARNRPRIWVEMVEKSVPVYEFFFQRAIDKWGTESIEGVTKIVKQVVPYLAKIENSVIAEVWAKKLAEKVGVDKNRVWEEIQKLKTGRVAETTKSPDNNSDSLGKRQLDLMVVGLLLSSKKEQKERIKKTLIGLPIVGAVGKLMELIFESDKLENKEKFIANLPIELRAMAEEAYLLDDKEIEEKEGLRLIVEWARRVIREERSLLNDQLRKAEEGAGTVLLGNFSEKLVKLNALERRLVIS